MCNLSEGIVDRTRGEDNISHVRRLMNKMGLSLTQAMDILDIPKAEQRDIADALAES